MQSLIEVTPLNATFVVDATEAAHLQGTQGKPLEILVYYMPFMYGPLQWGEDVDYDFCTGIPAPSTGVARYGRGRGRV